MQHATHSNFFAFLQVLYSLPELDGAIDTVPLGGLVAGKIFLIRERVRRLCARINSWVTLRRKHAEERKVAVLLYGFPPGVGATGTAALLNVPRSLERTLQAMRDAVRCFTMRCEAICACHVAKPFTVCSTIPHESGVSSAFARICIE